MQTRKSRGTSNALLVLQLRKLALELLYLVLDLVDIFRRRLSVSWWRTTRCRRGAGDCLQRHGHIGGRHDADAEHNSGAWCEGEAEAGRVGAVGWHRGDRWRCPCWPGWEGGSVGTGIWHSRNDHRDSSPCRTRNVGGSVHAWVWQGRDGRGSTGRDASARSSR